jgi:hypothetical protein
MTLAAKLDDLGNPAWIALTVVSFVVWWPLGLIVLGYLVGSGRMARWTGCGGLEEEQREFKEFLDRLRHAKDKAEFDQFMAERGRRPQGPASQPES